MNNKSKYIIVGIVWLFIMVSTLFIFYIVYAFIHLTAFHCTGMSSPPLGMLRYLEFLYSMSLIVVCLFFGLGIIRLR